MPADPEKLRKSYIKKARNILRLTPDKQEKAKKKLKQRLGEKKAHVSKLVKELKMYRDRDEKALVAYAKALQKKAKLEGRGEKISDFRAPVSREDYDKGGLADSPPGQRPPILRKDKTIDQWWDEQVKALEEKQAYEQADRDNLFEDNRTLLELEIDDLESQKAIINPLKFENMEKHFGGKLVHKLANAEEKAIEKQVKSEKASIKKAAKAKNAGLSEVELSSKVTIALNKRRNELHSAKLTDKNKLRFTEIRDNELYRINYGLKDLQADYKKLTGKKYAQKTD